MSYYEDMVGRFVDSQRYDGSSQTNKYTERDLSFDRNGNILSLKRYGATAAAPQDNLAYTYAGNKLMQLNSSIYAYDDNGNMVSDGRRNMTFTWNHLNLPATIENNDGEGTTVNYTYLADGTKVLAQASGTSEGYAYLGTMVYKLNNGNWTLETTPFTGGRFVRNASGAFIEQRHITDHLGSTRTIVEGDTYTEVEQNDYYPFGKRIADNTLPTTPTNRWRFSGKETQTLGGINLIDFGARLYDEDAVKWKSMDPMAEDYWGLSPYGYCVGNPIMLIDPSGASPIYSPDGSFLGTDDQGLQGDYIIMDKFLFEQGMAHDVAVANQWEEPISNSIESTIQAHFASLPDRPDYDGFVTIKEGVEWARAHVGAVKNPTPDNTLYLDASKIDFGRLSANNRHLRNQTEPLINLYWLANPLSISSINSTYALGSTRIRLLDVETGTVKLSTDTYDWDYHHKISFRYPYPRGIRDNLIFLERIRTGMRNKHGFKVSIYGVGTIRH